MAGGAETSNIAASPAIARQRRASTVHTVLSSGKFAIVEKAHEFTPVQLRPIIDRQRGRVVMGVVQGGSVSWRVERQRELGLARIPAATTSDPSVKISATARQYFPVDPAKMSSPGIAGDSSRARSRRPA